MSGLFKQFKTNSTKEAEGVEIEFPEAQNDDGSVPTFVISRMGKSNKAYSKALDAASRRRRNRISRSAERRRQRSDFRYFPHGQIEQGVFKGA
ncbi:hypothetical protein PSV3_00219 [Septimatrevirus PSV33]|uniref:Uncharacterized protein n=1 Tax=Pseudomonas phage PSV3 TaxID=3003632 RepID=A0AAE9W442_9CAUD|nr:tail assembly chaperone [Pseudomonas phage PSV3]WBF76921.1 hypothetical protein PSV3_00219 [Pseudomonas phage PSV3]